MPGSYPSLRTWIVAVDLNSDRRFRGAQEGRAIRPQLGQPALFHVPSLPAHDDLELSQGGAEVIGPYPCFGSTKGPWIEALACDADAKGVEEEVPWEPSQRGHSGVLEGPPPGLGSHKQAPTLCYKLLQLFDPHITHRFKAVDTCITGQIGLNAGIYAPYCKQAAQCPQFCLHHNLAPAAPVQPAHGIEQKGAQFTNSINTVNPQGVFHFWLNLHLHARALEDLGQGGQRWVYANGSPRGRTKPAHCIEEKGTELGFHQVVLMGHHHQAASAIGGGSNEDLAHVIHHHREGGLSNKKQFTWDGIFRDIPACHSIHKGLKGSRGSRHGWTDFCKEESKDSV
ncbi:hypothetical protein MC885_014528, partial [Smutsia gigantea]